MKKQWIISRIDPSEELIEIDRYTMQELRKYYGEMPNVNEILCKHVKQLENRRQRLKELRNEETNISNT